MCVCARACECARVLLIVAIHTNLGVQLFRQYSHGAFGDFGKSMYTMFGITTMDGWQELVTLRCFPKWF